MSAEDEPGNASKKRISGRTLAEDIRAGVDEPLLMAKHGLSHDQLQRAIGKLVAAGLLNAERLPGLHSEDPDLTMSMSLVTCPVCKHQQPGDSTECLKCGVVFSKVSADTASDLQAQPESSSSLYKYVWLTAIFAGLLLLVVALGWTIITARKEAQLAREEAAIQEQARMAAELKAEELQQRQQVLADREFDIKQAEYEKRVNTAITELSRSCQRSTEDFYRKWAAYERTKNQQAARVRVEQTRRLRAERTHAAAHFRAYASIVRDVQNLGVDYRSRSLTRGRLRQAAKSFQTKLFFLKTFPSASPLVVRYLETGAHHLMSACQSRRGPDVRSHFEEFWREVREAMDLMSQEIAAART